MIKEKLDKHHRQIAEIPGLQRASRRMPLENRRLGVETRKELRALAAAQKKTQRTLRALISWLPRDGDRHKRIKRLAEVR